MLTLLNLINLIALNVFEWSENRINIIETRVAKVKRINKAVVMLAICLVTLFTFEIISVNKNTVIKKEKKIEVVDKDFYRLKKFFPWLQVNVYKYILAESERQEVDKYLVLSVMKKESAISCNNAAS